MTGLVDILIPNFNGRAAVETCLLSILKYTPEPHRVVVYDDGSTAAGEADRLKLFRDEGLIDVLGLCEHHRGHGTAVNRLLERAGSEAVAIVDNDIQFLGPGWLTDLLGAAADPRVLVVCDSKPKGYWPRGFRPEMFLFWLGLINMAGYRDGMGVDWAIEDAPRGAEPWAEYFSDLYPPEENDVFKAYVAGGGYAEFDREKVVFDPGCHLRMKMIFSNPRGYTFRELPPAIRPKFRHWGHAQFWLEPEHEHSAYAGPVHLKFRNAIEAERDRLRRESWNR